MKTSTTAATIRLIVCCLGLTAFFTTADVAHATFNWNHDNHNDSNDNDSNHNDGDDSCRSEKDCDHGGYCGFDRKSIDNDNNGLTDFEDPACCDQSYAMALRRGRVVPKGETSRMRIRSTLAKSGLSTINPTKQDVFLQIRPAGNHDILCARVPASKFMARRRTFKYWSKMSSAPSA